MTRLRRPLDVVFAGTFFLALVGCVPPGGVDPVQKCKDEGRVCGWSGVVGSEALCGDCAAGQDCSDEGKCVAATCKPVCFPPTECGDDGCEGSCGTCTDPARPNCEQGVCMAACAPQCDGKSCGDDGCGGSCGSCDEGTECKPDFACAPAAWTCDGARYGDGYTCDCACGTGDTDCSLTEPIRNGCLETEVCDATGTCVDRVPAGWTCTESAYADGAVCNCNCGVPDPDCTVSTRPVFGCAGEVCLTDGTCGPCTPNCEGRNCGGDGCGGVCGPTGVVAQTGPTAPDGTGKCKDGGRCLGGICRDQCPTTGPLVCQFFGFECGNNGCGGTCGTCTDPGEECISGFCRVPVSEPAENSCIGRCGNRAPSGCFCDDRCETRGDCCSDKAGACCVKQCSGKTCGSDGCGGECGQCVGKSYCAADDNCAPNMPAGLAYGTANAVYDEGVMIPWNIPGSTGGTIASYSIAPPLPVGLALSPSSGIISGTPTQVVGPSGFTVTGTNVTGTTTATLTIEVRLGPPVGLAYATNPVTYTQGTAITPNTPSVTSGTPSAYTVSGLTPLPNGLTIDGMTGTITGTPTTVQGPTGHVITASNAAGDLDVTLNITINPAAPAISYTNPDPLIVNQLIVPISPVSTGGAVASYSISPNLKNETGLDFSTVTGTISGTPTTLVTDLDYVVTATNVTSSTMATIRISVVDTPAMPGPWGQQAFVKAYANGREDGFGSSVAIAGNVLVVGSPYDDTCVNGVVMGTAVPVLEVGPDGPTGYTGDSCSNTGAAYVYRRSGSTWAEEAYLKGADSDPDPMSTGDSDEMLFGSSVSISGNTIVVGAPGESSNTTAVINGPTAGAGDISAQGAGAAYVFFYNGSAWVQQAYLKAPDAAVAYKFGDAVAVDQDTIVVGSLDANIGGSVYVYTRSGSSWSHQQTLSAPNVEMSDQFGYAVAVSANTLVASAVAEDGLSPLVHGPSGPTGTNDNDAAIGAGAAYVFTRSGSVWTHQAYLKAGNVADQQAFGDSVSILGETIVVGAPGESSSQNTVLNGPTGPTDTTAASSGAAYVFVRTGGVWEQTAYLKASNAGDGDNFGSSVSLSTDKVLVGAPGEWSLSTDIITGPTGGSGSEDDSGYAVGAAYVFDRDGSGLWSQAAYFKAFNAEDNDSYGACVALSAKTSVVGSSYESSAGIGVVSGPTGPTNNDMQWSGAAYVITQ